MTPPPVHEHARAEDGNGLQIKIGGASLKQLLPWLLALTTGGGGAYSFASMKAQHDTEIRELKQSMKDLDKKFDDKFDKLTTALMRGRGR